MFAPLFEIYEDVGKKLAHSFDEKERLQKINIKKKNVFLEKIYLMKNICVSQCK